ncbi:MAG TPA: hypothetical protein VN678_07300 [Acidobacteriaceae bacterium]|nr:hypothetical protein [Acidobacteriaceae bacterium]
MKILFDQNVPRALVSYLTKHEVVRSAELGWEELRNGELLLKSEDAAFDVLITCDQNLEYHQRVTDRKIGIIALSTNNWPVMRRYLDAIANAVDGIGPGVYVPVNCGTFQPRKRSGRLSELE